MASVWDLAYRWLRSQVNVPEQPQYFTIAHASIMVGTSSAPALDNSKNDIGRVVLQNISDAPISLKFDGAAAVAGAGVVLAVNASLDFDGSEVPPSITAISTGASKTLLVTTWRVRKS